MCVHTASNGNDRPRKPCRHGRSTKSIARITSRACSELREASRTRPPNPIRPASSPSDPGTPARILRRHACECADRLARAGFHRDRAASGPRRPQIKDDVPPPSARGAQFCAPLGYYSGLKPSSNARSARPLRLATGSEGVPTRPRGSWLRRTARGGSLGRQRQ